MNGPRLLEDEIGRKLAEAQRTGELQSAESYGKPMTEDAGWEQTPDDLRMGFKILKNAGVVPAEVELFKARAALRRAVDDAPPGAARQALQQRLSELEQSISLRLEALRKRSAL